MGAISIIIPAYNAEKHIQITINSIICQNFKDWELILVNDGSTDNTLVILEKIAETDARIKVFSQENKGPSTARNFGIQQVKNPYITFVDADDTIREDYLEKLLKPVSANKSIDLVCAGYYEINKDFRKGLPLHDFECFKEEKETISKEEFIQNLFKGLTGVLWSKLFKTEIILNNKIEMPSDLKMSEDLIFIARYAKHINNVALVYENIYYYNRINEEGLTRKLNQDIIPQIKRFNELIYKEGIMSNTDLKPQLGKRTYYLLFKMLKDQAISVKNLKTHHQLVFHDFGTFDFKGSFSKSDLIFYYLLQTKSYIFAKWFVQILETVRKLKPRPKMVIYES